MLNDVIAGITVACLVLGAYVVIGALMACKLTQQFYWGCIVYEVPPRVVILACISLYAITFILWPIIGIIILVRRFKERPKAEPEEAKEPVGDNISPSEFITKVRSILHQYDAFGFLNTRAEDLTEGRVLDMASAVGAIIIAYGQIDGILDDRLEHKIAQVTGFVGIMEDMFEVIAQVPKGFRRKENGIGPMEEANYQISYTSMHRASKEDIPAIQVMLDEAQSTIDGL